MASLVTDVGESSLQQPLRNKLSSFSAGGGDDDDSADERTRPLSKCTLVSFGVAGGSAGWVVAVMGFYMTPFFLDVALLPANYSGTILLIGRFWDAFTDPLIGNLTDRTNTRWGRRRPWLLFSALPFGASYFAMWQVPNIESDEVKFAYYLICYMLLEVFLSTYLIPYATLLLEISNDVQQRNRLVMSRMMFVTVFTLLGALSQGVLLDVFPDDEPLAYRLGSSLGVIAIVVPILWTFFGVEERPTHLLGEERFTNLFKGIKDILRVRSYVSLMLVYLCAWMSVTLVQNNLILYITHSLGMPGNEDTFILGVLLFSTFIFLAIWTWSMKRFGKKTTYVIGMTSYIGVFIGLFFLPKGNLALVLCVAAFGGSGTGIGFLIPQAMLPDVVDEDTINTGYVREGLFFSFFVFFEKLAVGVALAVSNYALGAAGYINGGDTQPREVDQMLRILVGPVPAVLIALSLVALYFYPLTTEVVAEQVEVLKKQREELKNSQRSNGKQFESSDASPSNSSAGERRTTGSSSGSGRSSGDSNGFPTKPSHGSYDPHDATVHEREDDALLRHREDLEADSHRDTSFGRAGGDPSSTPAGSGTDLSVGSGVSLHVQNPGVTERHT